MNSDKVVLETKVQTKSTSLLRYSTALCFAIVVILALSIGIRGQGTINRLQDEIESISHGRANEQAIEDCRNLYEEDVQHALIERDLEQSDLNTAIAAIPIDATSAERAEATRQAISGLNRADARLRSASQAFDGYAAIEPPPVRCLHPRAKLTTA